MWKLLSAAVCNYRFILPMWLSSVHWIRQLNQLYPPLTSLFVRRPVDKLRRDIRAPVTCHKLQVVTRRCARTSSALQWSKSPVRDNLPPNHKAHSHCAWRRVLMTVRRSSCTTRRNTPTLSRHRSENSVIVISCTIHKLIVSHHVS